MSEAPSKEELIEFAKELLLHQAESVPTESMNKTVAGKNWTKTGWEKHCAKTRNYLTELGVSEEEIDELIDKATSKVNTAEITMKY